MGVDGRDILTCSCANRPMIEGRSERQSIRIQSDKQQRQYSMDQHYKKQSNHPYLFRCIGGVPEFDLVFAAIKLQIQEREIKKKMASNPYQPKFSPMSSSSMFSPPHNEFKRPQPFPPASLPFDPFARTQDALSAPTTDPFPRAMASQSMIATNSSSAKRATFGKLDSMARKITTTFKEEPAQDAPQRHEGGIAEDSVSQSMIMPGTGAGRAFFGVNRQQQGRKLTLDSLESAPKKRRESIDLGRVELTSETAPFMRRATQNDPKLEKYQSLTEHDNNGGLEALKQKNFEFLRKRKDGNGSETTASMIAPSIQGVQSMKNLHQFSLGSNFKKQQFLSPSSKQPMNDVKCPEDKPKVEFPSKVDNHTSTFAMPSSPNFQFKKKKAFEVPVEMAATKKEDPMMTAKQRRNARPQRQIKLSDFQLLQKLGKGAFGEVFIAQEKAIGFICVIKKMSKKRIKQLKVENHILREIKIQSYLAHNNLTALFGYFHDDDFLYLIIEALPDGSLQQVKKKRKMPERETAAIVKQVSEGLKYMHEESIIHRDLKPENLFVNDNVVKIGDFGCSIYNQNSGLRTTVVGCLEYSSPEQLSNEGYSEKIDAWSLGILTYELLFGKSPFEKDIKSIARNKEAEAKLGELTFPAAIPIRDDTKDFIENLLSEDPDKRMDMDEVLAHDFLREEMGKKPLRLDII